MRFSNDYCVCSAMVRTRFGKTARGVWQWQLEVEAECYRLLGNCSGKAQEGFLRPPTPSVDLRICEHHDPELCLADSTARRGTILVILPRERLKFAWPMHSFHRTATGSPALSLPLWFWCRVTKRCHLALARNALRPLFKSTLTTEHITGQLIVHAKQHPQRTSG
jgi:hypothetical protein